MRSKKYPLEALQRVRQDRRETSARALAIAIRAREKAERCRLEAEVERARLEAEAARVRDAESCVLWRGELSVADLQRQGAWDARTRWEDDERARSLAALAETVATARAGEGQARADVAVGDAEVKVVSEHQSRWESAGRAVEEAAEEEASAEAWRPRTK